MATVTLMLKENKVNEKGEMPLYIRIIKGRKAKFISLGIKVHPDLWNSNKLRVKNQYPNSGRVNALIAKRIADSEAIALDVQTKDKSVSSKRIKEAIMGKESTSMIKFMESIIATLKLKGKIGTHNKIQAVLTKLNKYLNDQDISFDDMDFDFLKRYEHYLRNNLSNATNTVHSNLKVFRKVFNDAIREGIIEINQNPFLKYKLLTEKSKRDYLTEDELKSIEDLGYNKTSILALHRDMYVFAAYAGGIRISDVLQLRWNNWDGTHIKTFTKKTKESIAIKLPPKATKIIEYYESLQPGKKKTDFIFPLLKNSVDYTQPMALHNAISMNTAYVNKSLKVIAKDAKIEKDVSFHTSRHTWATRALQKGMRIEYVSKLMGHSSLKTTMIYTKIVNSELDNAMNVFND